MAKLIEDSDVKDLHMIFKVFGVDYINQNLRTKISDAAVEIKIKEDIFRRDSLIRDIERKLRRRAFSNLIATEREDMLAKYRKGKF